MLFVLWYDFTPWQILNFSILSIAIALNDLSTSAICWGCDVVTPLHQRTSLKKAVAWHKEWHQHLHTFFFYYFPNKERCIHFFPNNNMNSNVCQGCQTKSTSCSKKFFHVLDEASMKWNYQKLGPNVQLPTYVFMKGYCNSCNNGVNIHFPGSYSIKWCMYNPRNIWRPTQ